MSTEKKTQHKDIRDAKAFKAVGQGVEKVGKIKFISEFKDFISKGNVMDMAVGMIVGAAFTAIVTSLVNNILTVSYTHLRAHETGRNLVCRLLLEKKKKQKQRHT